MQVTLGKEGLSKSWQAEFPETTDCVHCCNEARIGFVAHEGLADDEGPHVCALHPNDPEGTGYWLHDCCAVAVYFCTNCLETTSLYNQA